MRERWHKPGSRNANDRRQHADPGQFLMERRILLGIKPTRRPSSTTVSDTDGQLVLDGEHTGRSPRGPLRLVPLGPGADLSAEGDHAVLRVHLDASGIDLGAAPQGGFDPVLDAR